MLVKRQAKRQFHDRTGPLSGKQEALFIFLYLLISRVDRLLSRSIDAKKRRRFHMPSSLSFVESVMTLCRRSSSQGFHPSFNIVSGAVVFVTKDTSVRTSARLRVSRF